MWHGMLYALTVWFIVYAGLVFDETLLLDCKFPSGSSCGWQCAAPDNGPCQPHVGATRWLLCPSRVLHSVKDSILQASAGVACNVRARSTEHYLETVSNEGPCVPRAASLLNPPSKRLQNALNEVFSFAGCRTSLAPLKIRAPAASATASASTAPNWSGFAKSRSLATSAVIGYLQHDQQSQSRRAKR